MILAYLIFGQMIQMMVKCPSLALWSFCAILSSLNRGKFTYKYSHGLKGSIRHQGKSNKSMAWCQPRNIIADETDISCGSGTNIITEFKRESITDIDLLRAVSVLLERNGLSRTYPASSMRLKNKLNDLKLNEIHADSFLENMAIHYFKEEIDPILSISNRQSMQHYWIFECSNYTAAWFYRGVD